MTEKRISETDHRLEILKGFFNKHVDDCKEEQVKNRGLFEKLFNMIRENQKEFREEQKETRKEISSFTKIIYLGVGILITLQFIIPLVLRHFNL